MTKKEELFFEKKSGNNEKYKPKKVKPGGKEQQPQQKPEEQGHNEAVKEMVKESDKAKKKFDKILQRRGKILFEASSVFPFDLSPDHIVIDIHDISIKIHGSLDSLEEHRVPHEDLLEVSSLPSFFFGSLTVRDKNIKEQLYEIKFLKKGDALKAKRIILGIMVCVKQKINISDLNPEGLAEKLEELGKAEDI